MRRSTRVLAAAALTAVAVAAPSAAGAAPKPKPCRTGCADTTAPTAAINNPAAGSTITGTVTVTGTSSDDRGVASVSVAVDAGSWQIATGTTSWSWQWDTSALGAGPHTLTVRAVDTSGNAGTASETVSIAAPPPPAPPADTTPPSVSIAAPTSGATVSGTVTVSGTSSDNVGVATVSMALDGGAWQTVTGTTGWSSTLNTAGLTNGTHTLAVRAVDSSGNSASSSEAVSVSNGSTTTVPPDTQGSWVSPEGVTINVSSAGSWTIAQIYSILKANALDLDKLGPRYTINVQDQYSSQTQTSAVYYMGAYTSFKATTWLRGVNSSFATRPDETLAHEYGAAWSHYWYYMGHIGSWSTYEQARWTTSDGSLTLATDSRVGSTSAWTPEEIIAEDYRLLFGSDSAINERPTQFNTDIPDPRTVPGLRDFLFGTWRTG
jgi:hypothetical protein